MEEPVVLIGSRVTLRSIEAADRARLAAILAEPAVARWWAPSGVEQAVDDIYGSWAHEAFGLDVAGQLVGYLQISEELDPDYRHASIDLFIATAEQGLGYGQEAIQLAARHLFRDRQHHRITIDPAIANERAIATYRKVGFRPVGLMRAYERGPDGTWHDALLMDLLAEEFREA